MHIVPTAAEAGLVDTSSRMFRTRSKHASVLHAREFGAGVLERAGTVEDRLRGATDTVRAYLKSKLSRLYELAVKSRVRSSAHTRLLTEGRKLLSVLKDAEERDRDVQASRSRSTHRPYLGRLSTAHRPHLGHISAPPRS